MTSGIVTISKYMLPCQARHSHEGKIEQELQQVSNKEIEEEEDGWLSVEPLPTMVTITSKFQGRPTTKNSRNTSGSTML